MRPTRYVCQIMSDGALLQRARSSTVRCVRIRYGGLQLRAGHSSRFNRSDMTPIRSRVPETNADDYWEPVAYRAGSNSSIGFPSGSSTWICLPPGPVSISLRK